MKRESYDVCIIGGGAAGLCAAAALKMQDMNISVVIAEQLDRVGKKLITTGNGRCNITNRFLSLGRYHGKDSGFASYALERFDNAYTEAFFSEIGVVFTYDDSGRAYPYSLQASSVVDALRFAADARGVKTLTGCKVNAIKKAGAMYEISSPDIKVYAKSVICAGGLFSGGEKFGCDGSLLKLLKNIGYKTVPEHPAIVKIKTDNSVTRTLKGIKINAQATLFCGKKPLRSEWGEVLFYEEGLSGPPILQLSGDVGRYEGEKRITLDIMPDYEFEKVLDMLYCRAAALKGRKLEEYFTGMLNKRLGQTLIKLCGKKLSEGTDVLNSHDLKAMASLIKSLPFDVVSTAGFAESQVTSGGLDTDSFNPHTMMSKKDRGLYAVGEILDIDGDCGGFNLQWAWSSAMCAAEAIINGVDKTK